MEWFGWAGTTLFILCYAPQIYKTKKCKSIGGVSLFMWVVQWSAYTSCLIYSIFLQSRPLMFGYAMGWLITAWWLELARQFRGPKEWKHTAYGVCSKHGMGSCPCLQGDHNGR